MFDKQKFFDVAVDGIRRQGKRAVVEGSCAYRTSDGCRCAVGHNIPDEEYSEDMENLPGSRVILGRQPLTLRLGVDNYYRVALLSEAALRGNPLPGGDKRQVAQFVDQLQACHDGACGSDFYPPYYHCYGPGTASSIGKLTALPLADQERHVEQAFERFAKRWGLTYTPGSWAKPEAPSNSDG